MQINVSKKQNKTFFKWRYHLEIALFWMYSDKKKKEEEEDAPSGFESSPVQNMEKKKKTKQPLIFYVHN